MDREKLKKTGLHILRVRDTNEGDIIVSDDQDILIGSDLRDFFPDWHKHTEGWLIFIKAKQKSPVIRA